MSIPLRLTPGSIFASDYKVVRPLRTGGQGSIYVVEQLSTSKHRALKLMLPELVAQPTSRKRFELEAKVAARIASDHVVESIASGVDVESGTPWLAMELLEGQDLAAYVQEKKRLPPLEVLEIFSQLCHALGAAHEQGIVHRDMKPENIFLATPRRRGVPFMVKVLDFGIARIVAEVQTQSGATATGLGTPMWMAPEQAVPGSNVGPQTDVWPLGLIAFRLLTGYLFWKAPYDPGASVMMLMAEAFMHPLPTASERAEHYKCRDRLPVGFDTWFAKCVSRAMDQRWANAAEAFTALEPILLKIGSEASLPERPSVIAPTPQPAGAEIEKPEPRASEPEPEQERVASEPDIPRQPTGPGMKTWEGAPELAAEAVLSAPTSTPPPAPPPGMSTSDQAGLSRATSPPVARRRERMIVAVAATFGVLLGLGIVAKQRRSSQEPLRAPAATAAPLPKQAEPVPPSAEPAPPPAASSSDEGATEAAPASSAGPAAAAGGHRPKVCRPAGAKCFSNDDCCDRACHHWICKANAAMHDPYGGPGD